MRNPARGNQDLIKAMNRNLLINTLRREGVLSRTRLTKLSGLSVGTVSQITSDLVTESWVLEIGAGEYTGGRRQTLLRLNPDAGYAVGIKLMEDRIACTLTNLDGKIMRYSDYPYAADRNPFEAARKIAEIARMMALDMAGVKLLGVGIGLAGIIYPQTGTVHYSPFFGWRDVPLAQLIEHELNVPVYIANDVDTLTISEQLFGSGRRNSNFVVVTVGRGIGMGIVINHQVYQGTQGGAGELGHITMLIDGPLCSCGKRGCLESIAADPAVVEAVRESTHGNTQSSRAFSTLDDVIAAAQAGNRICREALARSGKYLGMALATVVNLLNPQKIILSGEGMRAGELRLVALREALQIHTFNDLLAQVELVIEPADDRLWARGAASLVLSKAFELSSVEAAETRKAETA